MQTKQVLQVLALSALLVGGAWPVMANHPQPVSDSTIQFDHDGDNEWWVEVLVKTSGNEFIATVEARAENGAYHHLQQKAQVGDYVKWGTNSGDQFRIPPGERVQFKVEVVMSTGGANLVVTSCFFTHPAGVEQCNAPSPPPPPPPPSAWTTTPIGTAGIANVLGDMAVSDADNDGRRDVATGTKSGVHVFERSGTTWSGQHIGSFAMQALAAGDGDGDGRNEIYGMSSSAGPVASEPRSFLFVYKFASGAWEETNTLTLSGTAADMTLGDIDGLPGPEIYVGMFDTVCDPDTQLCSSETGIYHIRFTDGVGWESQKIATLSGAVHSMWIGNADNNGRTELYVGHGTRHADRVSQIQFVMDTWAVTDLPGTGSDSGFSLVVAGDGNRDARQEVYTLTYEGWLRMVSFDQANGWVATDILTQAAQAHLQARTLFLGDGDGDGSQELYIGTELGQIYQVRWDGSAWVAKRIANPVDDARGLGGSSALMVISDADMDGRSEIYAAIGFTTNQPGDSGVTRVYQIKAASPSPPPGTFDATFTLVRGNNWWLQVNVAANAPVWGVDYRIGQGTWTPMKLESWGSWTAGPNVVDTSQVQFRARTGQPHDVRICVDSPARTADVYLDGALVGEDLAVREPTYPGSLRIGEPVDGGQNWGEAYWDSITLKQGCGDSATTRQTFAMSDVNGWTVQTSNGMHRTESTGISAGWTHMWRPGPSDGFAQATTPLATFDRSASFELSTRFLVPTIENHWFYVLDGAGVAVIIDYGTDFSWYNGDTLRLATLAPGAVDASACYMWSSSGGTPVSCASGTPPPPPPPPPGNFGATFTMVQGNVWWQQAQVTPSGEALSKVDLSLNGGAWQPLKLQTWGVREYAGSYHAVQGSIIQLRATSTTGATALSSCYQWIPASGQDASHIACGSTPPPPPPPSGFDATFTGVKGNDWWVQANVAANQPLAGVDVRVNCAASWKPLTKQSWGGWTASFNIPAGSKVDFAARSTSGAADASGGYTWPQATATSGCALGVWPQQGSFATYNIHHAMGGDGQTFVTDARLNLAYNNGGWTGICTGRSTTFGNDGETSTDWTATVNGKPPLKLPAATSVGATHNLAYFFPSYDGHTCDLRTSSGFPATVQRQDDRVTSMQDSNGAPITLRAWVSDDPAEGRYAAAWDTKLGLVLDWNRYGPGGYGGDLLATDAPVR